MGEFLYGIFKTIQGVFEPCVSVRFQKVIQGMELERFDGVFFAGGWEDDLALGIDSLKPLRNQHTIWILHENIEKNKVAALLVQCVLEIFFVNELSDRYMDLVFIAVAADIFR